MSASKINIVARKFSSAAGQQMIKPPIQVFGIEGRYATALFSASSKQKSLDAVEKDLLKIQGLMKTDKKFIEFVKDPSIKRKIKADAFNKIGASVKLNQATTNMLSLLAENGRLGKLNQVVNAFKTIMSANRGEVVCEVVTAKPLDADMKSKLESTLKMFLTKGQTLLLNTKVDPSLLGGMVISIDDRYVDMSVSSKIKKYSDIIATAV